MKKNKTKHNKKGPYHRTEARRYSEKFFRRTSKLIYPNARARAREQNLHDPFSPPTRVATIALEINTAENRASAREILEFNSRLIVLRGWTKGELARSCRPPEPDVVRIISRIN